MNDSHRVHGSPWTKAIRELYLPESLRYTLGDANIDNVAAINLVASLQDQFVLEQQLYRAAVSILHITRMLGDSGLLDPLLADFHTEVPITPERTAAAIVSLGGWLDNTGISIATTLLRELRDTQLPASEPE